MTPLNGFDRIGDAMRKQLNKFAFWGILAIALFAFACLCMQIQNVEVQELFSDRDFTSSASVRDERCIAVSCGACLCSFIYFLGYCFLEMGYFPLSFFKKTRYSAILGMVASTSGIVLWLVFLARYVLLGYDWQESGLRADYFTKDIAFFVIVEHVAFCASLLLLRRVVMKSAFMRESA